MLKERSKKDFYIGQKFYYLVNMGNKGRTTQPISNIREIEVEKIGSKYLYFSTAQRYERYEYGSDYCYLLRSTRFHGNQWERMIKENQLFEDKTILENKIYQMDLADEISNGWEVRQFLKQLSVSTLERIKEELKEFK